MEDPKALLKNPLAYVARRAEAWAKPLKGAWLLGVASGFLWPEAPPPKDAPAVVSRCMCKRLCTGGIPLLKHLL